MKENPQKVSHAILREMQYQTQILEDSRKQLRKIQGTITAVILMAMLAGCGLIVLAMLAGSTSPY